MKIFNFILKKLNKRKYFSIFVLAGLIHIEILLIALLLVTKSGKIKEKDVIVTTELMEQTSDTFDINKKREILLPVITKDQFQPEPVVAFDEISDNNQTDDFSEKLNLEGIKEAKSDAPLLGSSIMGNIGAGGGGGGAFGSRSGSGKKKAVLQGGGSRKSEDAVDAALEWLKRQQNEKGFWDKRKFGDGYKGNGFSRELTEGHLAITGLALLAFLSAGNTTDSGKYKETVKKGIDWVLQWQLPNGSFGETQEFSIYDNAICALVLSELFAMNPESKYKIVAQNSIDYLINIKKVHAGISSHANIPNSTSVNGWMLMAFKSAKIAGLQVPPIVFEKILKRLEEVTVKNAYGIIESVSYSKKGDRGEANETMSAVGMLMYEYLGAPRSELKSLANKLIEYLPSWGFLNQNYELYRYYYVTLALFQYGGEHWKTWNKSMVETLVKNQSFEGPKDGSIEDLHGSWDSENDYWGRSLGRIYTTAMATLCLEVYYRYEGKYKAKEQIFSK